MDVKIIITATTQAAQAAIGSVTRQFAGLTSAVNQLATSVRTKLNAAFGGFLRNQVVQAFSAQAIASFAMRTIEWADAMKGLSERIGVTTRDLQVLQKVAERSNVSIEAIATAFRQLNLAKSQASQGKGAAYDAFTGLGISAQDIKSKSVFELWSMIGSRIGDATQNADKFAAAVALLGRSADAVLPAMRTDIAALASEMDRAGQIVSDNAIENLARAKNQIDDFKTTITGIAAPILGTMGEGLGALSKMGKGAGMALKSGWQYLTGDREGARETEAAWNAEWDEYTTQAGVDKDRVAQIAASEARLKAKREAKAKEAASSAEADAKAAAKAEAENEKAKKNASNEAAASVGATTSADSLARIGLFRGGAGNTTQILNRQLGELRNITSQLRGLRVEVNSEE